MEQQELIRPDDTISIIVPPRPLSSPSSLLSSIRPLFTLAVPNACIYVLQNLVDMIALFFVGHLENGASALAAVGLGTTWFNLTSYYIVLGLTLVIDTLVSQSFGKGDFHMCGVYYYRTALLVTLCCVPFILIILMCSSIMKMFGIEDALAEESGRYAAYLIPSLFASIHFEMVKRFLNAQQIVQPTTVVVVITTAFHVFLCYVFIHLLDFSYLGAALAKTGTCALSLVLIWAYIAYSGCCAQTIVKVDREVFQDWSLVLQLALPSALLMCFDFWVYEIMNLMLARTSKNNLAANVGLSQVSSVLYMLPSGFGNAASTFVGNYIGAANVSGAKYYMRLSLVVSGGTMAVCSGLFLVLRNQIGSLFTSDPSVRTMIAGGVSAVVLAELPDSIQVILSRTLVALGRQKIAAASMFVAAYLVLLPLGYTFLLRLGWGVEGYWVAVSICNVVLIAQYGFWVHATDWDLVATDVGNRQER